jgi:hypothetical protein
MYCVGSYNFHFNFDKTVKTLVGKYQRNFLSPLFLKMEAAGFLEMLVPVSQITRRYFREARNLNNAKHMPA